MIVGRLINKLENDDILHWYQTKDVEYLLSKNNLEAVWNIGRVEGEGTHTRLFPEDMAITRSVITVNWDSSGRICFDNDTVILKFTTDDQQLLLSVIIEKLNLFDRLTKIQEAPMEELHNPLPQPEIAEVNT
jgi:hypothetical protein